MSFYNAINAKNIFNTFPSDKKFSLYDAYLSLSKCWSKESCTPRLKDKWNCLNITCGQCSITAFLIQDYFGGEVYGVTTKSGDLHCFNVIKDEIFDLTNEQFHGEELVYNLNLIQDRDTHFSNQNKFERYIILRQIFAKTISL